MPDSTRQWKRHAQVVIGKDGCGLLVENLRITFDVCKTVEHTPNTAVIKIYNLSEDNERRIMTKGEFDEIILKVGYEASVQTHSDGTRYFPTVFRGNITHVYRYRENSDYITEIEAGDGDKDYRNAVMNETLAAGTTNAQLVDRAAGSFKATGGTTKGAVQINDRARLRGKVISGRTRDVLHDVARDSGANWSIQDGQLQMVKANGMLQGEAIVITADTGMLGAPQVNDKGIGLTCLLNPQLRINGAIKLDNSSIKAQRQQAQGEKQQDPQASTRLDPDGIYKVLKIAHKGDTRGKDWASNIECIGLG
jgi:hypothetical protein